MLCVTLCFTTGCAQKVEDKKFLECSFHFNRIMSNQYSKAEYECFLNKAQNFYKTNKTSNLLNEKSNSFNIFIGFLLFDQQFWHA